MRALAFAWVAFVSTALARRLHAGAEGDQQEKSAFDAENRDGASIRSQNADTLASLFFAINPSVADPLRTRSAIGRLSSITSCQQSCTRQSQLAERRPRMDLGDDRESEVEISIEVDKLRSIMSSTMALAFALAPLAASAASDAYKLDRSGWIGGAASLIEGIIDFAHDGLANAGIGGAYGISIFFATLIIKTITLPLLNIQLETSSKMQQIQPIQKRIMDSYSDKQADKRQKLISRLLSTTKVNPLASLLPSFAQIPIFISLYRALQNLIAENKLEETFLWIPSLQGPISENGGLDWLSSAFSGDPTWGYVGTLQFLSLSVVLWFVQSASIKLAQPATDPNQKTEQEGMAKGIATFVPLLVTFFSLSVPAGLSLYWIYNSIFTTLATQVLKSKYKSFELPPEVQEIVDVLDKRDGKKRVAEPPRKTGFQAREKVKKTSAKQRQSKKLSSDLQSGEIWEEWVAYKDVEGNAYYYNPKTGVSDWTLPPGAKVGDWLAYKDAEGKTYYYNRKTGVSEWTLPPDA